MNKFVFDSQTDDFLLATLREDAGEGDITTLSTIPQDATAHGRYIAKESGILCGIDVCKRVYELLGGGIEFAAHFEDGTEIKKGDVIAEVSGNARILLTGERTGLNIMQHLSGIATRTAQAVCAVKGTNAKITDTRKTTPLMRRLEKYAVRVGGGYNHRFGLSDGILIKDNHIAAAGGILAAVAAARENAPHTLKIEVETESFGQIDEALRAGADIIMLDNMSVSDMAQAVKRIGGAALTEASGNMGDKSAEELMAVARTGVDIISIGALTHSVKALDISLKFTLGK